MLTFFFICKMFLSFSTDVYVIFLYWNISIQCISFIFICHLLMLTYFSCAKCSYHSRLMFMWFSVTETYQWSWWTSSSFVIDIFFVWKIFYDFNTAFDYLLMLTYFSYAKCSYHSRLMFMWFSCTETYQYSAHTSSSFVIYWCWHIFVLKMSHNFNIVFDYLLMLIIFPVQNVLIMFLSYSRISILLLIIYWCWLFFMCQSFFKKVSLSDGHKVSLRKFF